MNISQKRASDLLRKFTRRRVLVVDGGNSIAEERA